MIDDDRLARRRRAPAWVFLVPLCLAVLVGLEVMAYGYPAFGVVVAVVVMFVVALALALEASDHD